jgi:hypothetical protein
MEAGLICKFNNMYAAPQQSSMACQKLKGTGDDVVNFVDVLQHSIRSIKRLAAPLFPSHPFDDQSEDTLHCSRCETQGHAHTARDYHRVRRIPDGKTLFAVSFVEPYLKLV